MLGERRKKKFGSSSSEYFQPLAGDPVGTGGLGLSPTQIAGRGLHNEVYREAARRVHHMRRAFIVRGFPSDAHGAGTGCRRRQPHACGGVDAALFQRKVPSETLRSSRDEAAGDGWS